MIKAVAGIMLALLAIGVEQASAQSTHPNAPTPSAPSQPSNSEQAPHPDATQATPSAPPPTLTGEWGGVRTRLRDRGVDLTGGFVSEAANNPPGGQRFDASQDDQFTFTGRVDTKKLFGWKGGAFQTTITDRNGDDLTTRASLGVLQQVQEVYGRGQTWRLTEFWYQQQLPAGFDVKLGRTPQGEDFSSFSCDAMNLTFCGAPIGNINGDIWYNWPISQWGARLRWKTTDGYVMVGAYENNPKNLNNVFTLGFLDGATGVLAPVETGWTPYLGPNRLPGSYRIGAFYTSTHGDDVLVDASGRPFALTGAAPLRRPNHYGGYLLFQQQLTGTWKEDAILGPQATHGLTVYFNVTQTDRQTEQTDSQVTLGGVYVGPLPGRPKDDVSLSIGRTQVNPRAALAAYLADPAQGRPTAGYAAELYYSLHLTPWLIVRPNLQIFPDPGGYWNKAAVLVAGAKTAVTF